MINLRTAKEAIEELRSYTAGSFDYNRALDDAMAALSALPKLPGEGVATKLWQWDLQKDLNAYPQGPMAKNREIYNVIGWEGAHRGALLLSEAELLDLQNALRSTSTPTNANAEATREEAGERIIMAAWKEGNAVYAVERPGRHHSVAHAMRDAGRLAPDKPLFVSGFITSRGRFVDRQEGCAIARSAEQIITKHGPEHELFSEDMW